MPNEEANVGAMRLAFWSWMVIIGGGLLIMIVLPMTGR